MTGSTTHDRCKTQDSRHEDAPSSGRLVLARGKRAASRLAIPTYRAYQRMHNGSRTVGAACVVLNPAGELLLVRLSYRSGWGLPGGFCDRAELPWQTAERELFEETGIRHSFALEKPRANVDSHHRHVNFIFVARTDAAATQPAGWRRLEVLEVRWMPLNQLTGVHRGTMDMLSAADILVPDRVAAIARPAGRTAAPRQFTHSGDGGSAAPSSPVGSSCGGSSRPVARRPGGCRRHRDRRAVVG